MSRHDYSGYTRGCRCDACRAAKAAYMRAKRGAVDPIGYAEGITHGHAGYQEAKCRCDVCRAAKARDDKRRGLRRLEASHG